MPTLRIAVIAIGSALIGVMFAIALAAEYSGQYRAMSVLVHDDETIPSVVSASLSLQALGENDARYELEFVLVNALRERTQALAKGSLWLFPNPYPGLTHVLVADKYLDRYFAESSRDLAGFTAPDDVYRYSRDEYLKVRESMLDQYVRAFDVAVACEQRGWFVKMNACPSWSDDKGDYDPDHDSYMSIVFLTAPMVKKTSPCQHQAVEYPFDTWSQPKS